MCVCAHCRLITEGGKNDTKSDAFPFTHMHTCEKLSSRLQCQDTNLPDLMKSKNPRF